LADTAGLAVCWNGVVGGVTRFWRERVRGTERARDVSDACGVALVGLLFLSVGIAGAWTPSAIAGNVDPWWHVVPLAAVCGVMLVKRKHPLLALLAGCIIFGVDAVAGGSLGVLLGLIDLIYSAALFAAARVPRRLGIAVLVAVIGIAAATFILGGGVQSAVLNALQVFAIFGTPLWWGISVRQQKELADLASARAADLQRLAELRETEAVREERVRMARDLHDALAGNLSAIAIHSEAALSSPASGGHDGTHRDALSVIRSASVASLDEMRSMILLLRTRQDSMTSPARLTDLGDLVDSYRARGMSLTLTGQSELPALPSAVDQAAFRILQESLGNAARHAAGAAVDVTIRSSPRELVVTISNHRTPQGLAPGGGLGLTTMRERAEALGGRLSAGWGTDGLTWVVEATLPLRGAAQ
jgi:signal transduction histidine kinase